MRQFVQRGVAIGGIRVGLAVALTVLALAGCGLGEDKPPAAAAAPVTPPPPAPVLPTLSVAAGAVLGDGTTRIVQSGTSLRYGPGTGASLPIGDDTLCTRPNRCIQVTLTSSAGSTISHTSPAADQGASCPAVAAAAYTVTGQASPKPVVLSSNVAASTDVTTSTQGKTLSVCAYATSSAGSSTPVRIPITFDIVAPTPTLTAAGTTKLPLPAGVTSPFDVTEIGQVIFTAFPTISVCFTTSATTAPAPTCDSAQPGAIYYTTDGSAPTTGSNRIAVASTGLGTSTFTFSDARRVIRSMAEDDVGNASAVTLPIAPATNPWTATILFEGTLTNPNAGSFIAAQDVQLFPAAENFQPGISRMFLTVCEYDATLLPNPYLCDENGDLTLETGHATTNAGETAILNTLGLPTVALGYPYDLGAASASDNEKINLPGAVGRTVIYDLKFKYDPTGTGSLDPFNQALYVIDQDDPQVLVYPDPDATTAAAGGVRAAVFDPGYVTAQQAYITDFNNGFTHQATPQVDFCNAGAGPTFCYKPTAPTLGTMPNAQTLASTNEPAAFTVTGRDAAGNNSETTLYLPLGRTAVAGPAATDTQLGRALASGNFNANASSVATFGAKDFAIGEPLRGNGVVYLFYDGLRDQVTFTSGAAFATPLDISTNDTLDLTWAVDGAAPVNLVINLGTVSTVTSASSVTATELADAFNREVLRLVQAGTNVPLYMTAENRSGAAGTHKVSLRTRTGGIETCLTVKTTILATTLGLSTTRQGAAVPLGTAACVYDGKITGEAAGDQFGFSLAVADFVNADGYQDLAVGAPKANGGSGKVYLFYGAASTGITGNAGGSTVNGSTISASTANVTYTGTTAGDDFGWSLATGTLDTTDANPDLAVGAPGYTVGGDANAGKVYVFASPVGNVASADTVAATTIQFPNPRAAGDDILYRANERFGHALLVARLDPTASSDQLLVGAPGVATLAQDAVVNALGDRNPGRVYLYDPVVQPLTFTGYFRGSATASANSKFGWSLAGPTNLLKDHCEATVSSTTIPLCFAVGAPHDENSTAVSDNRGSVGIYRIGDVTAEKTVYGAAAGDELGVGLAVGDINGDGITDLFVGQRSVAVANFGAPAYGGLAILKGQATTPTTLSFYRSFSAIDWNRTSGVPEQSAFGMAILPVDTNGDGVVDELLVGAPGGPQKEGTGTVNGRVHVLSAPTFQ